MIDTIMTKFHINRRSDGAWERTKVRFLRFSPNTHLFVLQEVLLTDRPKIFASRELLKWYERDFLTISRTKRTTPLPTPYLNEGMI